MAINNKMAKTTINRSWREQKVMLKQRFSILSDKDFDFKTEKKEMMFDNLAVKLKITRAELESLFAELQTY
ncbi:general stress protein CsbD [Aquimarina sp. I32.4]|uniref:general stress protein CsbD n=1 Tax=Aquimarina sp. I32.4 TaxID=2053903 RepID=UPI000CDE95E2|nr:general stress protein CsbD [Aquimarina sp. I32.4]